MQRQHYHRTCDCHANKYNECLWNERWRPVKPGAFIKEIRWRQYDAVAHLVDVNGLDVAFHWRPGALLRERRRESSAAIDGEVDNVIVVRLSQLSRHKKCHHVAALLSIVWLQLLFNKTILTTVFKIKLNNFRSFHLLTALPHMSTIVNCVNQSKTHFKFYLQML